jgi:hypothetical protein
VPFVGGVIAAFHEFGSVGSCAKSGRVHRHHCSRMHENNNNVSWIII